MYFRFRGEKPFHARELPAEIAGEPVDDLGPPAMFFLPGEDIPADLPVKEDKLSVDRDRGFELRRDRIRSLSSPRNFSYPLGTRSVSLGSALSGFFFGLLFLAMRGSSLIAL